MTDFISEDAHLDNPGGISEIISRMQQGDDAVAAVSKEEGEEILADVEFARVESSQTRPKARSGPWAPMNEGGASNPPSLMPAVTSKEEFPEVVSSPSSVDGGHPVDDGEYIAAPSGSGFDEDDVEVEQGNGGEESEMDMMMSGLSEYVDQQIRGVQEALGSRIEFNADNCAELSKTISRLSARIAVLENKVPSAAASRTKTITADKSKVPVLLPPTPGHKRSQSQVSEALASVGKGSPGEIVKKYLDDNPNYPRMQGVRKKVIARLCGAIGFNDRGQDIPPSSWNPEGILKVLTRE